MHIFVSLPIQLCKPRRSAFFRGLKIKRVYEIFRINVKKQTKQQKQDWICLHEAINIKEKRKAKRTAKTKAQTVCIGLTAVREKRSLFSFCPVA